MDAGHAIAGAFMVAAVRGDRAAVLDLLAPDVVLVSDGGRERHAARRPVVGAERVGRFAVNVAKRLPVGARAEPCWVNGAPGLVVRIAGVAWLTQAFEVVEGRIARITIVSNPDKLLAADHRVELALRGLASAIAACGRRH